MASEPLGNVIRRIGLLAGLQNDLSRTDAELLECFASRRDEPAFAALMARHGPMVLGVCRCLLHDAQEAEDAFQAAFLVLARRAASIQRRSLLAAWLYGVAYRIAARLRGQSMRRRTREQTGVDLAALAASEEDASWSDVRPVVHEEVQRLPEKYREAVVLCFLEGKTHDEAAAQLHWPLGSVKGRLARAKDLLRSRLARRGLALSVGLLTTALAVEAGTASAALVDGTIGAGVRFAAGQSAAGLVSARVIALTQGALQTMWWTKWTVAAVLGLAAAALGVGGVAYYSWGAEPGARPPTDPAKAGARAADKPKEDKDAIQGTWRVAGIETGGKDAPDTDEIKQLKSAKWVFAADKITIHFAAGKDASVSSYKLDPSKKPKELDVTPLDGPENEKGKLMPAIYSLEGDVLKLCISPPPDPTRPTELVTKEGGKTMLLTLKREF